jgi:hypothetical protein
MENDLYKPLVITLIIAIIIITILNLSVRHKVLEKEGFSELYFEQHRQLPQKIVINKSYEIFVTISNNELERTNYILEIDSKIYNFSKQITLESGEYKTFLMNINAKNNVYDVIFDITQMSTGIINKNNEAILGKLSNNKIIINSINNYLPITFNIGTFGPVYHINLTYNELLEKPFNKIYEYSNETSDYKTYNFENITIFTKNKTKLNTTYNFNNNQEIFYNIQKKEKTLIAIKKPFIIKFYKENSSINNELEIHFWYEII